MIFIIKDMIREAQEKKKQAGMPRVYKKDLIISEFQHNTDISLKKIAKKYDVSYGYVKDLHCRYKE